MRNSSKQTENKSQLHGICIPTKRKLKNNDAEIGNQSPHH